MAKMTVYDTNEMNKIRNKKAASKYFDGQELDLTNVRKGFLGTSRWNDKIGLVEIHSGEWVFYRHAGGGSENGPNDQRRHGEGWHDVSDLHVSGFDPVG